MATQDKLDTVRMYTQLDPYHYTSDNRPLGDLDNNIAEVAKGVDAAKAAATVDGVALGILANGLIGDDPTLVSTIGYPGGLQFTLSQGFFASKENISGTDTRQITKLALLVDQFTGSTPNPIGAGNSIVYLVQARYVDVTTGTDNLPTYDPFNEHSDNSLMVGVCEINIKAGSEDTTGSEIAPTADAGWDGIFTVTVADTTTNITSLEVAATNMLSVGSAAGGGSVAAATDAAAGIVELATLAETQALSDANRVITPSTLGGLTSSETQAGIIEIATAAQATGFTDDTAAVTPLKLLNALDARTATDSQVGTVRLADNATTQTGTNADRAVTPASLAFTMAAYDYAGSIASSSTTTQGVVELATNTESLTGTDTSRAVTPASLKYTLDNSSLSVADASTSVKGVVELATDAEVVSGTDATRAITPAGLLNWYLTIPDASTSARGFTELATNAETAAGSSTGLSVTPAGAASVYMPKAGGTFTGNITAVDITGTGDVRGNRLISTSAAYKKENVATIENALEICGKLRGVSYDWKDTGASDIGFIADEILEVIPELVFTVNGKAEAMDYGHLGAIFANSINELNAKYEAEKERADDLEARLDALELTLGV